MTGDERVRAALEHWAPRFVANGIDFNLFQRTVSAIQTWDQWRDAWVAVARDLEAMAREAEGRGWAVTASEHYLSASMAYHFSKFVWFLDEEKYRESHRKTAECYQKAMPGFDFPAERVEVPFGEVRLPGYLCRPPGVARPPVVVLVPGLDSVKEELHFYARPFLRRGLATLCIDGPGQGETEFLLPMRADWEKPLSAVLDFLEGRPDLDGRSVGVWGVSMGGYYVCRAVAFEPRIRACVGLAGFYHLPRTWDRLPPLTREGFLRRSRSRDEAQARRRAEEFSLKGVAERITCPLLLIHGGQDRLFPPGEPEQVAREARGPTRFLLLEEGNHVCNNIPWKYRPFMADWMRERLCA